MPPRHMCQEIEQWVNQANNNDYKVYSREYKLDMWVDGAIIVGAGPSGMATAACLQKMGVPSKIIEKSNCIASLWQQRTYDRLHLHIPKEFCELPFSQFPAHFPTYPTRQQFVDYLQDYALKFNIHPEFNESVQSASYDSKLKVWRVQTITSCNSRMEYIARWVIVATGENAEALIPEVPGLNLFQGRVSHSCEYKNGAQYKGQKVLVVGSGNSGMEIALDLQQHNASPSIIVRSPVHILPREICGRSTFGVAMTLLKLFPLWLTDALLVSYALLALGNTTKLGIRRPRIGPMELKQRYGRTPVLDVGTLAKIKSGHIKVLPKAECITSTGVKFVNGEHHSYDAIVFATGYKSNVPQWLKDPGCNFGLDGFPKCGWKADNGLYVAGLSKKGILGASNDAKLIAEDISASYFKFFTTSQ